VREGLFSLVGAAQPNTLTVDCKSVSHPFTAILLYKRVSVPGRIYFAVIGDDLMTVERIEHMKHDSIAGGITSRTCEKGSAKSDIRHVQQ
jgi:hypothetical protein